MGEQAAGQAFQYGAIGVIAVVFAIAVVILWRTLLKREEKMSGERELMVTERLNWQLQEAKIRKECEERVSALTAKFAADVQSLQNTSKEREDVIRREFAEIMETVEAEASKSNAAIAKVLEKFYDRFVGPRPRY